MGGERGYDGGKKVKGRKRYLLLVEDIKGLVFRAKVHPADLLIDSESPLSISFTLSLPPGEFSPVTILSIGFRTGLWGDRSTVEM